MKNMLVQGEKELMAAFLDTVWYSRVVIFITESRDGRWILSQYSGIVSIFVVVL
jgi:hypothetical protein